MLQYRAVALQLKCYPINRAVGVTESREIINANLARLDPALDGLRIMTGEGRQARRAAGVSVYRLSTRYLGA
jgi:hypothetical protein